MDRLLGLVKAGSTRARRKEAAKQLAQSPSATTGGVLSPLCTAAAASAADERAAAGLCLALIAARHDAVGAGGAQPAPAAQWETLQVGRAGVPRLLKGPGSAEPEAKRRRLGLFVSTGRGYL